MQLAKSLLYLLGVTFAVLAVATRASGDPGGTREEGRELPRAPKCHLVHIKNSKFEPARLEIQVGDFVTWINKDENPHSALRVVEPAFDTGPLATDKSRTIQFTVPSDAKGFHYGCLASPRALKGVIVVCLPGSVLPGDGKDKANDTRDETEPPSEVRSAKTFTVYVRDQEPYYEPRVVEIQVGDSVRWLNDSDSPQTASRDRTPAFETGPLSHGKAKSVRFDAPTGGEGLEYRSRPHPYVTGRIVVKLPGSQLIGESLSASRERVTKSTSQAETPR